VSTKVTMQESIFALFFKR